MSNENKTNPKINELELYFKNICSNIKNNQGFVIIMSALPNFETNEIDLGASVMGEAPPPIIEITLKTFFENCPSFVKQMFYNVMDEKNNNKNSTIH